MPAAVAVPIITGALAAGATVYGARSSSRASRDASRLEHQSTEEALRDARDERDYQRRRDDEDRTYERGRYAEERDYGRQQYGSYLGRLQPFTAAGQRAVTNLSASTTAQLPGAVPTMGNGQMVRIQAPNGQIRDVPATHAQHYISLGGKQVG